ncbi:MAG TPA: NAD(P)/FAD-dependent oxidoreductase [Gemmataceae bacterium]|jgi:phytoene dehydrogenase-like protein|nr:NAD(P)/FAD-dependent oxidoreductase [Gemmataceae bacterium]
MWDALVIGAGPNGLVAAVTLAKKAWRVLVLEAQARPGGAVYSTQSTLPGYWHDVGAAFFPFASTSPAFRDLDLAGAGLNWQHGRRDSCHPAPDGSCATISRDLELSCSSFGVDGEAWVKLSSWQRTVPNRFTEALLAPLPGIGPAFRLGPKGLLRLAEAGLSSTAAFSCRHFQTEAARRVLPGLALHADFGPDDFGGASMGLVLALLAGSAGFPVPVGGAKAITEALLRRLREYGGELRLEARITGIVVEGRRAVAVLTADGEEIPVRHAILADVGAPALYLKLLPEPSVPGWVRSSMRRFRYGWGTFKMDWALSRPVPWSAAEARESAVVHAGDSMTDLRSFTAEVRGGQLPTNPYLVIGQQSLLDSSRAPEGGHTLWAYTHVPSQPDGGWPACRERFADQIEARIESLAPGFRACIRARAIVTPPDLEAMNANLVGGDLGGGSAHFDHQLIFRPIFPYFRYRTPVRGVYLCSASAHPGAGVHGACGYNAAHAALQDCREFAKNQA